MDAGRGVSGRTYRATHASPRRVGVCHEVMSPEFVQRVLYAKELIDGVQVSACRRAVRCPRYVTAEVPACHRHLTPEEREAAVLLRRGAQRVVDRWLERLPPMCWFWAVPDGEEPRLPNAVSFMFAWQKARCAICGRAGQRGGLTPRTLVLDHDHHNGLVRGLLCHRCNKIEGLGRTLDGRFANYRRWPPARLLSLSVAYAPSRPSSPRQGLPSADPRQALQRIQRQAQRLGELVGPLEGACGDSQGPRGLGDDVRRTLDTLVPVLQSVLEQEKGAAAQERSRHLAYWLDSYPHQLP